MKPRDVWLPGLPITAAASVLVVVAAGLASGSISRAAATPSTVVQIVVDPAAGHLAISPLIYGIGDDPSLGYGGVASVLATTGATLVRLGGNRYTAFNWENNASNAGSDWFFQNDEYLSSSSTPGAAVSPTVIAARAAGAATLVTVPIGDYVAADKSPGGDVRNSGSNYLTTRFKQNRASGGPLSTTPTVSDGFVYQNQFVYWLKQTYPTANVLFELDNEPNDWNYTHAEVFARNFTYSELVARNLEYAAAIKAVWPTAKVSGPTLDGWQGQEDAVNSDGTSADYLTHGRFLDYYLQQVRAADSAVGHRTIDTLDLHWYPQVTPNIFTLDHSPAQVEAREQAPRSLWDPTYVENSWITSVTGNQPINLLPRVKQEIATANPGMGLAISEWNYGGGHDISGGIATADTLGIFGRQGVTAANHWPQFSPTEDWTYGGFAMFRNYDGAGASFGDTEVAVSNSDTANTSVYASIDSFDPSRVVIVAINKELTAQPTSIQIAGTTGSTANVYTLTSASPTPQLATALTAPSPGNFTYPMPAQSVSVIVPASGSGGVPPVPDPPAPDAPPAPDPPSAPGSPPAAGGSSDGGSAAASVASSTGTASQVVTGTIPTSLGAKRGAALPKRTSSGGVISWASLTKSLCVIRRGKVIARKKVGVCILLASSPPMGSVPALQAQYAITIRK